jgi:hypothetical protein
VAVDQLPDGLRRALAELDAEELRIPVELVVRRPGDRERGAR